jgi:hypothetical protein
MAAGADGPALREKLAALDEDAAAEAKALLPVAAPAHGRAKTA